MASLTVQLADAIVEFLNGREWPMEFTAARYWAVKNTLTNTETLRIAVVPFGRSVEPVTRGDNAITVSIGVQILGRITATQTADLFDELTEQLAQYLTGVGFTELGATWAETENDPVFSPEFMDQHNLFFSILVVTYNVAAARPA